MDHFHGQSSDYRRSTDGWTAFLNNSDAGKKTGKKLKINADQIDADVDDPEDEFKENLEDFGNHDD